MNRAGFILVSLVCSIAFAQAPPYSPSPGQDPAQSGDPQQRDAQQGPVDEPGRPVARLSLINGDASVRRGDSGDWVAASPNAPLMVEDSISVGPGGYAEVQFDRSNFVRIAGDSEARLSTLDNGRYGVQVIKGMVTFRVLRQTAAQSEVATPQVAVRPGQNSAIRVELLGDGYSRIEVRAGDADVFTPQGVEKVRAGSMMMVRGTAAEPEYQITAASPTDEWDGFNQKRDTDLLATRSYQYVSPDVPGAEDLDRNGQWTNDPQYGNVWAPNVPADWAPYRTGRWVWEDYYGWTWIAAEPWGWAPYHYGSWYYRGGGFGWCWYPGPRYAHTYWRPALVAFFGFGGWRGGFGVGIGGGIGWVPLAPYERFHPWYGRGWYGGRTTVVNNVTIVNNTNIGSVYRNARINGGVSGLGAQEFAAARFHSIHTLDSRNLQQANLVRGAVPLQPTQAHLGFSDRAVSASTPRINMPQRNFAAAQGLAPRQGGFRTAQVNGGQQLRTPFAQQQSAFGNRSRGQSAPSGSAAQHGFAQAPQAVGPGGSGRSASSTGGTSSNGGWQRFSSTPNNGSNVSRGEAAGTQGWQRFGSPQSSGGNTNGAPRSQWNSFGRPSASDGGQAPRSYQNPQRSETRGSQLQGQRYESPRSYSSAPNSSAPRQQNFASPQSGGGGREFRVAPPMVQQRSQPSQNSSGGGRPSGGSGSSSHASGGSGGHGGGSRR